MTVAPGMPVRPEERGGFRDPAINVAKQPRMRAVKELRSLGVGGAVGRAKNRLSLSLNIDSVNHSDRVVFDVFLAFDRT